MWKKIGLLLPLLSTSLLPARDKAETWIEVTSPHFVVATNSNERQARRIASQFERMRSVFHVLFPDCTSIPPHPSLSWPSATSRTFARWNPLPTWRKAS